MENLIISEKLICSVLAVATAVIMVVSYIRVRNK